MLSFNAAKPQSKFQLAKAAKVKEEEEAKVEMEKTNAMRKEITQAFQAAQKKKEIVQAIQAEVDAKRDKKHQDAKRDRERQVTEARVTD
jgi:uncharacterized membrane protein YdfJ with MMPL/SSD domain